MFSNAKTVNDWCFFCGGIHTGSFTKLIRVNVTDFSNLFRRIISHKLFDFIKAFRKILYVILVNQIFFYHYMHHAVCKCNVGTRAKL